ncbi:hypothetical protein AB0O14_19645 [Microbacterium foliorum]|uniref:hypothetical protein n=1 Tax=Rothia terrae TaxID=396015 RepID=UPI00343BC798
MPHKVGSEVCKNIRQPARQVSIPRLLIESALASETPTQRKQAIEELFALNRLLVAASNNVSN